MSNFNKHILPPIVIVSAHFGENFKGHIPDLIWAAWKRCNSANLLLWREH